MNNKILGVIVLAVVVVFAWNWYNNYNYKKSHTDPKRPEQQEKIEKIKDTKTNMNTNPQVILHTNLGDITLELFADKAPKTVENFLKLTKRNFYDGTLFHRVIKTFMIQGGDPLTKSQPSNFAIHGTGDPGYKFADEFAGNDTKLVRGILAMANAGPDTNGSQFFIITAPATDWLDGKHTPFGRVIAGMEVVDKIEQVKVNENAHPLEDVKIEKVEIK
ncbi:MAG: peptidylprolyl isomerase [Patescibacteria group bacterium]